MNPERPAEQLAALGHVARLSLLRAVVQAGADGISTTDLQARLDIPWTTLNHHLDRLVDAGLVVAQSEGKFVYHTADREALHALAGFYWRIAASAAKVDAGQETNGPKKVTPPQTAELKPAAAEEA